MSDLLAIAQSGVRAYARALDAVADNVANAATPGHVRRTAALSPMAQGGSSGPLDRDPTIGSGVRLTAIVRAVDLLGTDTLRRAEADAAALDTSNRWLAGVEGAISGPNSLEPPLNSLFGSLADLASDPANPALRDAFLARADALADGFNRSAAAIEDLGTGLLAEAQREVTALNTLSQGLAEINVQLRRAPQGSGAAAALADSRDRTLARMALLVTIDVRLDARGQAEVRVPDAGGPLLVRAQDATSARIVEGAAGLDLRVGPGGADEPAVLRSGVLAGLSAASVLLGEARGRLDALAHGLATEFNALHRQGTDFAGSDGQDLFLTNTPLARPALANGGSARVVATAAPGVPVPQLNLDFDGTSWTLARADLSDSVTGALPLVLDGITIEAAGLPRLGDVFRIGPASGAAALRVAPLSGAELAVASRWLAEPGQANSGDARFELRVDAASIPPAVGPFTMTALAGGQVQLSDSLGTVLAIGAPGDWLPGDGFSARASGTLADGDAFRIQRSGALSGSNGGAIALLGLRQTGGAAGTLSEQQEALVSRVAVALSAGRDRAAVASENRNRAAEALSEASGVDLNTEAAEMLRLQQAFQANARIIQTARDIFDAILNAAR